MPIRFNKITSLYFFLNGEHEKLRSIGLEALLDRVKSVFYQAHQRINGNLEVVNTMPEIKKFISEMLIHSIIKNYEFLNKPLMSKHWNETENLYYHFFLILNYKTLSQTTRRKNQVFKEMEAFIKTKTSIQCRSHHIKKCKDIRRLLLAFYDEQYESRFIDISHSVLEIKKYLAVDNLNFIKEYSRRRKETITLEQILSEFQDNLKNIFGGTPLSSFQKHQSTQTTREIQTQTNPKDPNLLNYAYKLNSSTRRQLDQHFELFYFD